MFAWDDQCVTEKVFQLEVGVYLYCSKPLEKEHGHGIKGTSNPLEHHILHFDKLFEQETTAFTTKPVPKGKTICHDQPTAGVIDLALKRGIQTTIAMPHDMQVLSSR